MHFPAHDIGLLLYHNDFKARGLNAEREIEEWQLHGDEITFKDEVNKQRSIDSNEIWELHWSPITSSLVFLSAAPTLEELIIYCMDAEPNVDVVKLAQPIELGELLTALPEHESLELAHNPHLLQDLSAKDYFEYEAKITMVSQIKAASWRDQMIATGDFWEMTWVRPDGPRVKTAAPSLPELLAFSQQVEDWAQQRRTTQLLKRITR